MNPNNNVINEKTFEALTDKINNQSSKNVIGHTRYTTSGNKNTPIQKIIWGKLSNFLILMILSLLKIFYYVFKTYSKII